MQLFFLTAQKCDFVPIKLKKIEEVSADKGCKPSMLQLFDKKMSTKSQLLFFSNQQGWLLIVRSAIFLIR